MISVTFELGYMPKVGKDTHVFVSRVVSLVEHANHMCCDKSKLAAQKYGDDQVAMIATKGQTIQSLRKLLNMSMAAPVKYIISHFWDIMQV